jgi:phosphomannomutase/phosphoglucomutase
MALDVGTLPTPALYHAVYALGTDGGVQVTGSHNPPEFNGFKMVLGREAFHGDEIQALWEVIVTERWRTGNGRQSSDGSALARYREAILSRHRLERPVKVVVDCGNGAGSLVAVPTLQALGAEVTPLFCESDGTFPNHHPDPTVPENLRDLQTDVRRGGAELGIAFDGDADRIGAVDETGEIVYGDQLLVILGRDAVRRFGPDTPVIFDVKCSDVLPRALSQAGARPVMWKTGHSLIKSKMKELEAPLAGEMSGHMFFGGDYFGFDDALFAAARLLEIVSRGPGGLAPLLADLPRTYATPEIRVDAPDEEKFAIVERAAEHFPRRYPVNTIDGVRIGFPHGWGLLRASNTQPILVLRFEATDPEALEAYRGEVVSWLAGQGVRA